MPRASHSRQRHHPRKLKGLLARRPPDTSTQQARAVTTPATRTHHQTAPTATPHHQPVVAPSRPTQRVNHTSHTDTQNGHGTSRVHHKQPHQLIVAAPHAPNTAELDPTTNARTHHPLHYATPRTRALTTVGAAAGAGVGTVGAGCITSHDNIVVSDPHTTTPQQAPATGTVGAECITSHNRINEHRH
jgi:hypothetical protein